MGARDWRTGGKRQAAGNGNRARTNREGICAKEHNHESDQDNGTGHRTRGERALMVAGCEQRRQDTASRQGDAANSSSWRARPTSLA